MAETEIEGRFIEVNFGRLEISKERSKPVTFPRPFTDENISYVIKKNCSYKSIKPNFYLDHYEGVLKPHQDFKLVVTYRPTIASVKDIEVFDYSDSDNERIKITLTGVAVGPHLTFSVKRLDFYKMPNKKVIERKVEISNDSLATARFKMDLGDHDIFQVQPLEGTLKPNSYQYLTVRFRPNKPGLFARKVFCVIWNSEPFVLDVLGRYSTQPEPIDLELRYFTTRQTFGFEAYMEDSLMTRKDVPPFSMTANYLDFGCVLIDGNQPRTRVISVTNHRTRPMVLDWNRGTETRIFKITPNLIKIPSNKSVLFEVEFNPDQNYNVFQESLTAQVDYTKEGDSCTIPLTTFLKVQGHSFPENEGWITHIEVLPDVVYWQPCAPGEKVSTTFLLRNRTHLPVIYKLVPPKISNVTAKPMMGKFRNYEIVAVQLRAEALKIKTYIEEWQIIINGREDRPITVYFHGESCLPIVEIGTKNKIDAGSVQNGSLKTVETFMTNLSYYTIRYQFVLDDKSFITISPMSGTLPCNEVTKLSIQLMGNQCAPGKETFVCEMRIIDGSGAIIGNSYDIEVEIVYETSFSQLCACPDVKDFGRITFGNRVKCEFQAMNFGESSIYFEMCQTGDENHDPNFRIKPYFGEIKPKMSRHFSIIGFVSKVGSQTLNFGYYNRRTKDSPLVTGEPLTLFTLNYFSEFPIIQVDEIVEHNFGELFSKKHFFEDYFQIPRLNQLLHDIQNDETVQFSMRLPDVEMHQEKEFYLKLALTNVSDFDSTVNVKRKKICDCTMEEISAGLSERKKGYNCPHRETLQIDLEENNFLAKSTRFLTIRVKYTLPNVTVMCYNIELTNHRTIELLFTICSILPDLPKISTYTPDFNCNLKDIFIGLKTAPVQMFWFYNNTHNLLNFHLDTEEIGRRCRLEGFKVWEILNPVDQILPYQSKALLVRFHPIEAKTYSLNVDLKFYYPSQKNSNLVKFKLQGSGVVNLEPQPSLKLPKVPKFISNFPASLSLELLEVKRMPVWSCRKELLFIKNNSRGKIVQYIWGSVNIENVIEINTDTKFNILQPKEIQPVVVTIKSLSLPCLAALQLPCELVEYSDLVIHKITKETHEIAENRIDDFMEDEPVKNKRPVNPIKVVPPPPTLYVYVTIEVTTLDAVDFDLNVDKSIQIKQFPNQSLENISKNLLKAYYKDEVAKFPEKEKVFPVIKVNEGRVFCDVLEQVLSEVLFSNMLKHLLEQSSKASMHFYNEFIMDDRKVMERKAQKTALSNEDIERYRKNEINNFFNQPKLTELSNILQNIICDSVFNMVQCSQVSNYDLTSLDEQIEKSLYTCRAKTCNCKNLASNK